MADPKTISRLQDRIRASKQKPSLGLGGMIKAGLSAIGITEERVSKAIGKPCGCGKRAEKLDKLGYKLGIGKPPSEP
jgi:hypothetical protein